LWYRKEVSLSNRQPQPRGTRPPPFDAVGAAHIDRQLRSGATMKSIVRSTGLYREFIIKWLQEFGYQLDYASQRICRTRP